MLPHDPTEAGCVEGRDDDPGGLRELADHRAGVSRDLAASPVCCQAGGYVLEGRFSQSLPRCICPGRMSELPHMPRPPRHALDD